MEQIKKEISKSDINMDIFNDSLSAIWVDGFTIGMRSDKLVTLSALQFSPAGSIKEQTRLLMSCEHAQKLIEQLSNALKEGKSK